VFPTPRKASGGQIGGRDPVRPSWPDCQLGGIGEPEQLLWHRPRHVLYLLGYERDEYDNDQNAVDLMRPVIFEGMQISY